MLTTLTSPHKINATDYFGIPRHLVIEPGNIEDLKRHLQNLENKNKRLGVVKAFGLFGKIQREVSFYKMPIFSGASHRGVWYRETRDVVVKYDYNTFVGSISGNTREFQSAENYRQTMQGIWAHFPVWYATDQRKFLVMA